MFNKWSKYHLNESAAFELKVSPSTSLSFKAVQPHQEAALLASKHTKCIFKIPDAGWQNPFDSFMLAGAGAYIVIMFSSKTRGKKDFVMIDIDAWMKEKESSKRKSLTEERALQIGRGCVL